MPVGRAIKLLVALILEAVATHAERLFVPLISAPVAHGVLVRWFMAHVSCAGIAQSACVGLIDKDDIGAPFAWTLDHPLIFRCFRFEDK